MEHEKLTRHSSFADPSRATLPSTTPPNPCRSPSHRKTPLPLSRPRRYDYNNNNTDHKLATTDTLFAAIYPTLIQPAITGHQGTLRLQRASWRTITLPLIRRRRFLTRGKPRKRQRLVRGLQSTAQLSRPGACELFRHRRQDCERQRRVDKVCQRDTRQRIRRGCTHAC
jgi:hypothetical protein